MTALGRIRLYGGMGWLRHGRCGCRRASEGAAPADAVSKSMSSRTVSLPCSEPLASRFPAAPGEALCPWQTQCPNRCFLRSAGGRRAGDDREDTHDRLSRQGGTAILLRTGSPRGPRGHLLTPRARRDCKKNDAYPAVRSSAPGLGGAATALSERRAQKRDLAAYHKPGTRIGGGAYTPLEWEK